MAASFPQLRKFKSEYTIYDGFLDETVPKSLCAHDTFRRYIGSNFESVILREDLIMMLLKKYREMNYDMASHTADKMMDRFIQNRVRSILDKELFKPVETGEVNLYK
jgi:hypothetical protein